MYPLFARTPYGFIHTYTLLLAAGVLLSLAWVSWRTRPVYSFNHWLNFTLVALVGGLMGGRAAHLLVNWNYYTLHPAEIMAFTQGGLGYHGAIFGSLIALLLWYKGALWGQLFALAPAVPLLHTFGWLACYAQGCAAGQESYLAWYAADLPDAFGVWGVRLHIQAAGVVASLLILAVVWWLSGRWTNHTFWLSWLLLSLLHLALTFGRGDAMPLFWGWRVDSWASLVMVGLVVMGWWMQGKFYSHQDFRGELSSPGR